MCRDQSANKVWKQRLFINLLTQASLFWWELTIKQLEITT